MTNENTKMQGSPLPEDSAERKTYPLYRGLFRYFPRALAAVARHSYVNNEKHNPGEPMHWAREKSADHADCLLRHALEGEWLPAAWRALAQLELALEGASDAGVGVHVHPDMVVSKFGPEVPDDPDAGRTCLPSEAAPCACVTNSKVPVIYGPEHPKAIYDATGYCPGEAELRERLAARNAAVSKSVLVKRPFTVYLCGPITGKDVDYQWRRRATSTLATHGIVTLNPLRDKDRRQISNLGLSYKGRLADPKFADRDHSDIEAADAILAHFPYDPPRQSIGSFMEIGGAAIGLRMPVVLCTKVQTINDHLFTRNFCTLEPGFGLALERVIALAEGVKCPISS